MLVYFSFSVTRRRLIAKVTLLEILEYSFRLTLFKPFAGNDRHNVLRLIKYLKYLRYELNIRKNIVSNVSTYFLRITDPRINCLKE